MKINWQESISDQKVKPFENHGVPPPTAFLIVCLRAVVLGNVEHYLHVEMLTGLIHGSQVAQVVAAHHQHLLLLQITQAQPLHCIRQIMRLRKLKFCRSSDLALMQTTTFRPLPNARKENRRRKERLRLSQVRQAQHLHPKPHSTNQYVKCHDLQKSE